MPFTGTGTGIQNANDIFFSSLADDNILQYNNATAKWNNIPILGTAALAYNGGSETVFTANATGATTLNLANGNIFSMTLTGNTTFTFSGATAGKGCSFGLYLHQNGTGGRTVTWPASVKWSGGAPTLTTTPNITDILVFETINGGTTWYGSLVGVNFS
ncbi:MAG: hypothetical protein ABIQ64_04615 [Candidatus Saccharimonadales bacterium]